MACFICGRDNCAVLFHPQEEQERYSEAIHAFQHAVAIWQRIKLEEMAQADAGD